MRWLLLLCAVLGFCATDWVSAVVYQDLELDAVVIDDNPDENLELETPEESTTELPGSGQSCTNANGISGTCKKFEQCFPYLSNYDSEDFENFQMYDILKEAAGPCPGSAELVCCPDYKRGLPTKKIENEAERQTTEIPSNNESDEDIPKNGFVRKSECGSSTYQFLKVVGGRQAEKGEFPYTVALLNKGKQFCGGSLISDQWILTAAHCIVNLRSFNGVTVNVGDHDHSIQNEVEHQSRGVKKGFYNKNFSMRNLQHDVALLQLDRAVTLSETAKIVCLSENPPPYSTKNAKAVLSGWGKTGKHKPPSNVLRTVEMSIISHEKCKALYANEAGAPPVTENMVCAGDGSQGMPNLRDACNGDSGGPLVIFVGGKATQIGVVSWGKGCGDKPGVYTRVDRYLSWINKNSRRS